MLRTSAGFVWLWLATAAFTPNLPGLLPRGGAGTTTTGVRPAQPRATVDATWRNAAGSRCTARELSRAPLVVEGGRELYLEPVVFVASGNRVLLAGKPSYLFLKRESGATAELASRHAVFGAVIEQDGSARTVPPPPINDGKVTAVAGIAAEAGMWRLIFAELDSIATDGEQEIANYWHALYDGQRWSSIERLPRLAAATFWYYNNSNLAQNGDTTVWASVVRRSRTQMGIAVFERRGSEWTHRILDTPFAQSAELIHLPDLGFILAVPHSDSTVANDRTSLFLYARSGNWALYRKVQSADQYASGASLHSLNGSGVLSWMARDVSSTEPHLEFRALTGRIGSPDERALVVDRPSLGGVAAISLDDASIIWVAHHGSGAADTSELHLVRSRSQGTAVIWKTPYPYRGGFAATGYLNSDVLIAGPVLDEARELLVTMIIRVRIECASGK